MEVLSKFLALTIMAVAVFIVIPFGVTNLHDETIQERVKVLSIKFSDEVREQGKITQSMWETYIAELDATGYLYDVDMVYTKNIISPGAKSSDDDYSYITERTEESYYTDDITAGMYDGGPRGSVIDGAADAEVHFNAGDYFSLAVRSKTKTMFDRMAALLNIRTANTPRIEVHAGGEIRDENW